MPAGNPYLNAGRAATTSSAGNPYLNAGRTATTAPAATATTSDGGGGFLGTLGKVADTALDVGTLGASHALGLGSGYVPPKAPTPGGLGTNLFKDIGKAGIGFLPGAVKIAGDTGGYLASTVAHPLRPQTVANEKLLGDLAAIGKSYEDYYNRNVISHVYQHPLQPLLDALTVISGGASVAGKLGEAGKLGSLSERAAALTGRGETLTRSPAAAAGIPGAPVHVALTSTRPLAKLAEVSAAALRRIQPEGVVRIGDRSTIPVPGELRNYGKVAIKIPAERAALKNLEPYRTYLQSTKKLTGPEWAALNLRSFDIHPTDLAELWQGTPAAKALTPRVRDLMLEPSPRLVKAETLARSLSAHGESLLHAALPGEKADQFAASAVSRPLLPRALAESALGREVRGIHGEPYYTPHTLEPVRGASPLGSRGGGKGVQAPLGTSKFNQGILFGHGRLHLGSDVLGPEFLRRVKLTKYNSIHDSLLGGAVPVTETWLRENGLPHGWEYVRENASTRIPPTLRAEGDSTLRDLIPNPENLSARGAESKLNEGFSTKTQDEAHASANPEDERVFHIVPSTTVRAATGEFTRSNAFVNAFLKTPLKVWRSAVLGLRVGFLTNNLVGNAIMYAVRTGGRGALRDLFMAIKETHGAKVAQRILDDPATPPDLAAALRAERGIAPGDLADFYRRNFPEQTGGLFGTTQSPAVSTLSRASSRGRQIGRDVTGAIPKLTAKVAEEAPRRGLIRHYIRHSPEFRRVYKQLPRQSRSFETAAQKILSGKGGREYQAAISKQVDHALGNYLDLSSFEQNVMRNALPFYTWYRAITLTTAHLAVENPLRAQILAKLGQIGNVYVNAALGPVPSFLQGSIPVGNGPGGTRRVLATSGLNPYNTLGQIQNGDVTSLGLNPFVTGPLEVYGAAAESQHTRLPHVPLSTLIGQTLAQIVTGLPPAQLAAPYPPSQLYPNRNRTSTGLSYLGIPLKEYDPQVAAAQAAAGR